jgi:hypothetical protein
VTTYNQTTISGDTCEEVNFTVTIDAVPLDLTDAKIVLSTNPNGINLSTGAGLTITDGPAGQFRIDAQVITAAPANYAYFIKFFLADGTVKTYITGTWSIEFKG